MRFTLPLVAALGLSACATQFDTPSNLSRTDQLGPGERRFVEVEEYADADALDGLMRIALPPAEYAPGVVEAARLDPDAAERLRARLSQALCQRLARAGYEISAEPMEGETELRATITGVTRNNVASTGVSRAVGVAVPGPLNPRVPVGIGALGAEAELLTAEGEQIAAMRWASRNHLASGGGVTTILEGRDGFSEIADAVELSSVFADAFGDLLVETRPEGMEERGETPLGACRVYDEKTEGEG
jgi:hypothetical protein